ncbi:hypothetical protein ASD21_18175 [Caulobacter sp. Root1455]|jgi:hypothetical protein|nr:hypothetical protein ASD21_18175 [Caulobacter sp. Root1455]
MFGPVLDVAIGLVFTIVIYATLLSALVETVSGVLKLRARALEDVIIRMLEDPVPPSPRHGAA